MIQGSSRHKRSGSLVDFNHSFDFGKFVRLKTRN